MQWCWRVCRFSSPGKMGKKEHMCRNSAATRKMTINLAGTHYAPIAAFAKIEDKPEKVRQKRKTTINMCLGLTS